MQSVRQGFAQTFEPIERANDGQDMGGVGALFAARAEQTALATEQQQVREQRGTLLSREQSVAKLAQHREVKARISQLERERILPVDTAAHGIGGLAVSQVFEKLEDGDEHQARGRKRGLSELR